MSFGLARFPFVLVLNCFDFGALRCLYEAQNREIATGRFIADGETMSLLGPPGGGLDPSGGRSRAPAIVTGYSVHAGDAAGRATGQGPWRRAPRGDALNHYAKPKLLIVDAIGYLPFQPDAAHLFVQRASRRSERGAMLVTSNLAVGEWASVFGDPSPLPFSIACYTTASSSPCAESLSAP